MTTCELYHETTGRDDAPPLVLGSSLGTTLEMWDPQIGALATRLKVIRFDYRGHGRSPVPSGPYTIEQLGGDVLALLDRLGIERFSYCGLSLGGMVGMWLAINAPARILRLVLVCTSAHMPPASAWRERAAAVRSAASTEIVADAVLARWFTAPYARDNPDVIARYRRMIAATPAEGYAACCEAIAPLDLRDGLPRITAATLVIAGSEDPAAPPAHARTIASGIPAAQLEILDQAAHLASVQRAEDVTRLIVHHLGSQENA